MSEYPKKPHPLVLAAMIASEQLKGLREMPPPSSYKDE